MQLSEGFIIKQFHNTIWLQKWLTQQRMLSAVVPLSQRQIFQLKPSNEQSHNSQLQSTPRNLPVSASTDCVSLFGPTSAQLALRQPLNAMRQSLKPLRHSSRFSSNTMQLLPPSVWPLTGFASLSPGFYVDALSTLSVSLLLYSLPLSCNSDHSFDFLSKPCPRKSNS